MPDADAGKLKPYDGPNAGNYVAKAMAEHGLIPVEFADRAFAGYCAVSCDTAEEAARVAAAIEDCFTALTRKLRESRADRVRQYVLSLLMVGKPIFVRGQNGQFEEIR